MTTLWFSYRLRCAVAARLLFVGFLLGWWSGTVLAQTSSSNKYLPPEITDWDAGPPVGHGCGQPVAPVSSPRVSGWIGGEYLGWWLSGDDLPPLVTDSPANIPIDQAGILGNPNTRILSGNDSVGDDWRHGFRVFGGLWLDTCHCWAVSGDYFHTGDDDYRFRADSDPNRIVTRPFFNTQTGQPDAELVSVPNELDGTVVVAWDDTFEGAGLALNHCLWRCCTPGCSPCDCGTSRSLNCIVGYRWYQYDSDLAITENLLVLPGTSTPLVPGTQILVEDRFAVRNEFHGGEIGISGCYQRSWCWIDGMAKLALGSNRRTVRINGQTVNTVPQQGTARFLGGLLTSEVTNIGTYEDNQFIGIPEFRVGIGALLTHGLSARLGYNIIIWDDVVNVSSALPPNLAVDPRNLPPVEEVGGLHPRFEGIRGSTFVAHGFTAGLEWAF
jgi:hypothetical protein